MWCDSTCSVDLAFMTLSGMMVLTESNFVADIDHSLVSGEPLRSS